MILASPYGGLLGITRLSRKHVQMATSRTTSSSVWIILSVAVTVVFGVFSFIWSVVEGQITELRTDMAKRDNDERWVYATKDFVIDKVEGIKDEQNNYITM